MRALLVCAAPADGATQLVASLAADADVVIAVDGGGAVCLAAGVTPDVLVGDLDSISPDDVARIESAGAPVLRFPAEKDASDLELAIGEARSRGATEIVATAAASGRLDHTLAVLAALSCAADLAPCLVEPSMTVWLLSHAGRDTLGLHGEGSTVSLLAWGGDAIVSASGTRWPLDRAVLGASSTRGLSNRVAGSAQATITVHEGTVLVVSAEGPGATRAREI